MREMEPAIIALEAIASVGFPALTIQAAAAKNVGLVFAYTAAWFAYPVATFALLEGTAYLLNGGKDAFEARRQRGRRLFATRAKATVGKVMGPHIIYDPRYNISLFGMERLHSFDSKKYGHVVALAEGLVRAPVSPAPLSTSMIMQHHSFLYRLFLRYSFWQMRVFEVPAISMLPGWIGAWRILEPMRLAAGGTLDAVSLAIEGVEHWKAQGEPADAYSGLSINLGGGYHHASHVGGHGFCAYADIGMAIRMSGKKRVLVVDLDVHQGDGTVHDARAMDEFPDLRDVKITLVDFFNPEVFPGDREAEAQTDYAVHGVVGSRAHNDAQCGASDDLYLDTLERVLPNAIREAQPDLVIYNAGTDILEGDPLGGGVAISTEAIATRDAIVLAACGAGTHGVAEGGRFRGIWERAGLRRVPVVWLLSGGYQPETANVIADSMRHANEELGLGLDKEGEPHYR